MNVRYYIICLCLFFYLKLASIGLLNAQEDVELISFVDNLITSVERKDRVIDALVNFAQEEIEQQDDHLIIFVDNIDQIPLKRSLRIEYFKVLVAYNQMIFDGFLDTLRLMYGRDDYAYGHIPRIITAGIKEVFFNLATGIANDTDNIIMQDFYSREELFIYARMSERLTELFNELFEI